MTGPKQRIIITGGLGYLGQRMAHFFQQLPDFEVVITSRSSRVLPKKLNECILMKVDLNCYEEVAHMIEANDVIVHLAAPNEIEAGKDVKLALEGTAITTYNVLKASHQKKARQVIYFSTFHVYGSNANGLITEHTLPRPVHPYAISHRTAEDFCFMFKDRYDLNTVVFRLSNSVGAPLTADMNRWTLVVNDMCRQAVLDGQVVLKSYGNQLRDFVPIEKVCASVQYVMSLSTEQLGDGLFNLGYGQSKSVYDMASMVQECGKTYNFDFPIVRGENGRGMKTLDFEYSTQKLDHLGFRSDSSLEKSVANTFAFCMNHKEELLTTTK